jgi:hypothetical protein
MKQRVIMVRTVSGEFIIGTENTETVIAEDGSTIESNCNAISLKDARIFNIQMTGKGAAIAFIPPFPFCTTKIISDIEIDKSNVILVVDEKDIDTEIINGYKSNISGLDLSAANSGKVII